MIEATNVHFFCKEQLFILSQKVKYLKEQFDLSFESATILQQVDIRRTTFLLTLDFVECCN